jgi:hypothetical protein
MITTFTVAAGQSCGNARYRGCPQCDSNAHWTDFEAALRLGNKALTWAYGD